MVSRKGLLILDNSIILLFDNKRTSFSMFFNREATAQIDFSEVQFACCLVTQPAYKKGFLARVSRNSKSLIKKQC